MPSSKDKKSWQEKIDHYLAWNQAIADAAFPAGLNGQPVYLQLSDEDLDALGAKVSGASDPYDDLRLSVRGTLSWEDNVSVFGWHVNAVKRWRADIGEDARPPPPPCVGLLAIFVFAAEHMHGGEGLGANNYYDRLLQELKVPGVFWESVRGRVSGYFRSQSPVLWDALREWLERWDRVRGIYTVRPIGGYTYVGMPVSQAIVRKHDRDHLRELFAGKQYDPSLPPSRSRLQADIDQWINQAGSSASKALRQLWNGGHRDPVLEIAQQELAAWEPSQQERRQHTTRSSRPIKLAIQYRRQGLGRVPTLYLLTSREVLPAERFEAPLTLTAEDDAPGEAQALASLRPISSPSWAAVQPADAILEACDLISGFRLHSQFLDVDLKRDPRAVVPFAWDQHEGCFVECDQVERGQQYVVLAHELWGDKVAEALDYVTEGAAGMPNAPSLPSGWVLFDRVEPVRWPLPESMDSLDVAHLIPELGLWVSIGGGLPLSGVHTWHVSRMPELAAASEDEDAQLAIQAEDLGADDAQRARWIEVAQGAWFLQVRELPQLAVGDYRLKVSVLKQEQTRRSETATLHLRSADCPRELTRTQKVCLGHLLRADERAAAPFTPVDLAASQSEDTLCALVGASPYSGLAGC